MNARSQRICAWCGPACAVIGVVGAWNGVLAFWIPVVVFTVWVFLISAMVLRAIGEQERQGDSEQGPVTDLQSPAPVSR